MPQPLFFGDATSQLFGVYHPPVGRPRQRAVVICNPLGQEHMRAHRCLRQIAIRLSQEGAHVFRFDYFGTGDSAGSLADARLETWLHNIDQAVEELKAMSMSRRVSLLGLRLGATLAVLAARQRSDVDSLLLWDPVVRGDEYFESLRRVHQDMLADLDRFPVERSIDECQEHELLGFHFPDGLVADIQSLALTSIDVDGLRRCTIVKSRGEQETGAGRAIEAGSGPEPEYFEVEDKLGWDDAKMIKAALIPTESPGIITERLIK